MGETWSHLEGTRSRPGGPLSQLGRASKPSKRALELTRWDSEPAFFFFFSLASWEGLRANLEGLVASWQGHGAVLVLYWRGLELARRALEPPGRAVKPLIDCTPCPSTSSPTSTQSLTTLPLTIGVYG